MNTTVATSVKEHWQARRVTPAEVQAWHANAGQTYRHVITGREIQLAGRYPIGTGFYLFGGGSINEKPSWPLEAEFVAYSTPGNGTEYLMCAYELVRESPRYLHMAALVGPCGKCHGSGKGSPHTHETDGNYRYVTSDECGSCGGSGLAKYSITLQELKRALAALPD